MLNLDDTCRSCGCFRRVNAKNPNLPSLGSKNPKILVVIESPTLDEDRNGKSFSSRSVDSLVNDTALRGVDITDMRFCYAVRCPTWSATPHELNLCGSRTIGEIEKYKPERLLVMGSTAAKAVWPDRNPRVASALHNLRGSVVPFKTRSGEYIPAMITHSSSHIYRNKEDFGLKRVWLRDIANSLSSTLDLSWMPEPTVIACKTQALVVECFEKIKTADAVAFDFETTSLFPHSKINDADTPIRELHSVAFSFADGMAYSIPLGDYWPPNMRKAIELSVAKWLTEGYPDQIKIAHNAKFDLHWGIWKTDPDLEDKTRTEPLKLSGQYEDTQLMSYALNELVGTSSLKVAAWRYLGAPKWSVDVTNVRSLPLDHVLQYNALDSYYTFMLYTLLTKELKKTPTLYSVYKDVLLPATLAFLPVEMRGMQVDRKVIMSFLEETTNTMRELQLEACALANDQLWNFGSSEKLEDYFAARGIIIKKKTPSGALSFDAGSLGDVVKEYDDPMAKLILKWRTVEKLKSTYIVGIIKKTHDDGKLHGNYTVPATKTGRTSSQNPNMQNFPSRKDSRVRSMILAPPGHILVSADYGQIEARLFAAISGDTKYIEDLMAGYDIHMEKAIELYHEGLGWSLEDAKGMRSAIKGLVVFPAFYGAGARSIALACGIPEDLARKVLNSIFERYPNVRDWQDEMVALDKERGYVESLFGRRRRSPVGYNELLNFPSQSTASDITLTSMIHLGRKLKVSLMIHDDLTFCLPDDDTYEDNLALIRDAMLTIPWCYMKDSPLLRAWVPLSVECKSGPNWGELKPVLKADAIECGITDLQQSVVAGNKFINELSQFNTLEVL